METVQFFLSVNDSDGPTVILKIPASLLSTAEQDGAYTLSFIVSEGADTVQWLEKNLENCFVYGVNKVERRVGIPERVQASVKTCAGLWLKTVPTKQGKYAALAPTYPHLSLDIVNSRRSSDQRPSASRSSISSISSGYGRRSPRLFFDDKKFQLEVVSIRADTISKITSIGIDGVFFKENSTLHRLLDHLSSLEWVRLRDETNSEPLVVTIPVRPSADYSIMSRPSISGRPSGSDQNGITPIREAPGEQLFDNTANELPVQAEATKVHRRRHWYSKLLFWKKIPSNGRDGTDAEGLHSNKR